MTLNQPTSLNCPACGAPLDADGTSAVLRCKFCGNTSMLPGIRPGRPTQDYLARVVNRITVAGALFLGIVAVAPFVFQAFIPSLAGLSLGGTSILIVVSVVVETMKQLEAQLMMRNYEGFIR